MATALSHAANTSTVHDDVRRLNSCSLSAAPHTLSIDEIVGALRVNVTCGHDSDRAAKLLEEFGHNELPTPSATPVWRRVILQFHQLIVWILIAAALISLTLGDRIDALAILAIVVLNGALGFFQEERAERSLAALRKLSAPTAKVLRDGNARVISAKDIAPGDLLELEAGDCVPADARLVQAFGLQVQEAALTGESMPVEKDAAAVCPAEAALGDRVNMIYMGTVATAGKATAVVVATGQNAELGRISQMLQGCRRESTPLERRLAELGRMLIVICLVVVGVILAVHLWRGEPLGDVFMMAVSLAVAAVPEGLPAVVTVALAVGVQRMARRNALIRKLHSVETLGCVSVICSDKTGTLTRNEMTVQEIVLADQRYLVSGSGYAPRGDFLQVADRMNGGNAAQNEELRLVLEIGARCNHARLLSSEDGGSWQVIGDPTEGALLTVAAKAGMGREALSGRVLHEIPFDSDRKLMSVVVEQSDGNAVLFCKGAPERILASASSLRSRGAIVSFDCGVRERFAATAREMASRALRVLALAYRVLPDGSLASRPEELESELVFVGLVGMIDPPREEAKRAVAKCRAAGIRPVMITGDHPATALAIARELHIAGPSRPLVTGEQLDAMSDDQLAERVSTTTVYARVSAAHKLRIVRAWQRRDHVVGMTGDGVNDAPAVQAADVGIAMGITGTDVTKEASDIVLTDDNFASIINAVEEGRGVFDNVQKVVVYLLSCNASEVLIMFFAAIAGWPVPLLPLQILWINLVTDGLPALALGLERPDRDLMLRAPRSARDPVITWRRGGLILGHGLLMAAVAGTAFWLTYQGDEQRISQARTVSFSVIALSQLFYSLSCRSQRYTMPEVGPFTNPYLLGAIIISVLAQLLVILAPSAQAVFKVAAISPQQGFLIAVCALTPVTVIETAKLTKRWMRIRLHD